MLFVLGMSFCFNSIAPRCILLGLTDVTILRFFQTSMCYDLWSDEEFSAKVVARTSIGRWGQSEDLKGLTVFLASPASDFITGEGIVIDGGILGR